MGSTGSVFSQTLQEITHTKLEELAKKRNTFEQHKAAAIENADKEKEPLNMLLGLAHGCKLCFGITTNEGKIVRGSSDQPRLETELCNLQRFIDQARFDPSVSSKIIEQWRSKLLKHLDVQSLKYQYADLYGKLTVEWLQSSTSWVTTKPVGKIEDEFEHISVKAKLQAKQKWESEVFEEKVVDRLAIDELLKQLFDSDGSQKALKQVRNKVTMIESFLAVPNQFNATTLSWVLKSLLASDRLTNEKRQALRDFQSNNIILTEISDVLNMKLAAVDTWSWGTSVSVEARRQLNGRYNIHMHEDLLQSIFLEYIGLQWSTKVKDALSRLQEDHDAWSYGLRRLTPLEKQRRQWFVPASYSGHTVEQIRNWTYRYGFFLSQLKDDVNQNSEVEEGAEEADFAVHAKMVAPASRVMGAAASHEVEEEKEESDEDMGFGLFDGDPPGPDITKYKPKNSMDAKQRLLHLLSTEILTRTKLYGGLTCFRSSFDSLRTLLPHATIRAVLSFFGVSEKWLLFFDNFLQAPLKFLNDEDTTNIRKRGTPLFHPLSDLFSEIILFCLDFLINYSTNGELLWRTDDDFWFWSSSHETCVGAWSTIRKFCQVMGVDLDERKSASARMLAKNNKIVGVPPDKNLPEGKIRWGMIVLSQKTGRFIIDQSLVDKHVEELRKQLKDKESSLFAWVQAYSTYASVFFTTNFGKPANCFGREHIDAMLIMHERVQKTLFSAANDESIKSVVDWLKSQIEQRFGVKDVPDGYLFFPTNLGGLEVKSPFITPLQLRQSIVEDPNAYFEEFLTAEQAQYEIVKRAYLEKRAWEFPNRHNTYRPEDPTVFMPFEEWARFREQLNYGYYNQLVEIYKHLLQEPQEEPVENDQTTSIDEALNRIPRQRQPTITAWYRMDSYWKWVTMLYGPEILEEFDGFQTVDTGLLPMGMVSMFRSGKVDWLE